MDPPNLQVRWWRILSRCALNVKNWDLIVYSLSVYIKFPLDLHARMNREFFSYHSPKFDWCTCIRRLRIIYYAYNIPSSIDLSVPQYPTCTRIDTTYTHCLSAWRWRRGRQHRRLEKTIRNINKCFSTTQRRCCSCKWNRTRYEWMNGSSLRRQ